MWCRVVCSRDDLEGSGLAGDPNLKLVKEVSGCLLDARQSC